MAVILLLMIPSDDTIGEGDDRYGNSMINSQVNNDDLCTSEYGDGGDIIANDAQ